MDHPANMHPRSGPWEGIDERPNAPANRVRDGLNVVFGSDGLVSRRPGRRVVATDAQGRRVAGLHQYVNALGQTEILAYLDKSGANPGGLFRVNWNAGTVTALTMPAGSAVASQGRTSVAVNLDGKVVLADPEGRLLGYDGAVELVKAMKGLDATVQVESYLTAPPLATFLAVWRDRLVAAAGPESPRLVALSENKWSPNLPDAALADLGAPNVWPSTTNFDLSTEEGDVIKGLSVLGDRLSVLGRTGVNVVDEDAVAPYARNLARQNGCIAPRSVVNIGDRLLYLGDGDVLTFDGARASSATGEMLQATLGEVVDWSAARDAVGVHFRREKEYRLWVPVRGLSGNQLCLVFNYDRKVWRKASHWYLFDIASRRDLTYKFDVTAALSIILPDEQEVLLTGDSAGRIWREDVGEDDEGQVFPAFVALAPVDLGAEWETLRDWYVDCVHDGSYVGALAVTEGRKPEQEIVRVLAAALTGGSDDDIPYALRRMLSTDQTTWASATAWPIDVIGPRTIDQKFGVAARSQKIQPVLLLPGQSGAAIDPTPGGVRQLEIGVRPRVGRR